MDIVFFIDNKIGGQLNGLADWGRKYELKEHNNKLLKVIFITFKAEVYIKVSSNPTKGWKVCECAKAINVQ